jgi:hypothetical protein
MMDKVGLNGMIAADNNQLLSLSVELTTVKEEEPSWPKRLANMISACGCGKTASNSSDSLGFSKAFEYILKPNQRPTNQVYGMGQANSLRQTRHTPTNNARCPNVFAVVVRYRFASTVIVRSL